MSKELFVVIGINRRYGPNLRIAPGGRFFHGVTADDLPCVIE